jgi:hypothetical protein
MTVTTVMTQKAIAARVAELRSDLDFLLNNIGQLARASEDSGFANTAIDLDFVVSTCSPRLDTLETRSILPLS